eukprot:15367379-Alexandrium_andersonii.AAC.1
MPLLSASRLPRGAACSVRHQSEAQGRMGGGVLCWASSRTRLWTASPILFARWKKEVAGPAPSSTGGWSFCPSLPRP